MKFNKKDITSALNTEKKTSFVELAKKMRVQRQDNRELSKLLFELENKGEIISTPDKMYLLPKVLFVDKGKIKINPKGFGFVDLEKNGEKIGVFFPTNSLRGVMDGDELLINVFADKQKEGKYLGVVKEVVKHNRSSFVGKTYKENGIWKIKPLDTRINGVFIFQDTKELQENYEVKVKIVEYGKHAFTIKLERIIGHVDDALVDIEAAIEDANVPHSFATATSNEAAHIPKEVDAKDCQNRVDLRNNLIVTIDGDDTKDFDDAIEIRKLNNGNYLLGIHIADVTYYVKENTPLDEEALLRGTSIYLADRVIPMLPEELSNGICSLNPNVDRLVLSTEIEIDNQGKTVDYKIFQGVINSRYRLTYREVNDFYAKKKNFADAQLEKMLTDALELSKIMRKYKENEGYIDFEITESKIILDDNGKTIDIVPRERLESEILIEDFMVRANETVAAHTANQKLPFIYRVHDKPDMERVINLQRVIKILGMDVSIPSHAQPSAFAEAIKQIKQTRFDDFIKIMMLRTMSKAEYSQNNIGHFGLASNSYTHFTSPIRRYPDLMVHRMLRTYFIENNTMAAEHFKSLLPSIAEHTSLTEVRAVELERRVADIKKAEFYEKFIGQKFTGTIVSVLSFGFFVEFPNKVNGLVHISSLESEYVMAENGYALKNSSGRNFTVGDQVEVFVVSTSKDEGKINLVVADMFEAWKNKQSKT